MRTQFIVAESNKAKRKEFFKYIIDNYSLKIEYPYDEVEFIKSSFPFVVDFKEKAFWICNSITCLACASQAKLILSIDEFMKINDIHNKSLKRYIRK